MWVDILSHQLKWLKANIKCREREKLNKCVFVSRYLHTEENNVR